MSRPKTVNRRDLVATVTGGAVLGAIWGAAFPVVASERRPSIAVVGHRNAQVILIDASPGRVLLLSGEPDDELLQTLPAMMTVFRQRIDVVVATPDMLSANVRHLADRWRIGHAMVLSGHGDLIPLPIGATIVSDVIDVELGDRFTLEIRIGHRDAWRAGHSRTASPLWCASLQTEAGDIVIAPDVASIHAVGPASSTLMIVPEMPAAEVLAVSPTSALAVNYDSASLDAGEDSRSTITRIYPRDVARVVIAKSHLELPEWTIAR